MTNDDRITREFRVLRRLILGEGRFAHPVDLLGAGGVLFRTFWHVREGESAFGRWSTRSGGVCPGDALGRAAEAYGFRLARPDHGGIEGSRLEARETEDSIGDRVRAFRRSIDEGLALATFGRARLDLALYLDHVSNFIDSSRAVAPFRREGESLLRAATRPPGGDPLRLADAMRSDRLFRVLRGDVRKAGASHRRGVRALERVFGG